MKPWVIVTSAARSRCFPRRYAGASLKRLHGRIPALHQSGFPRRYAGASLKREPALDLLDAGMRFPRRYAGASLKPR